MANTFTPKSGTGYFNLSGPNQGLTGLGAGPIGPSKPGYVQGTAGTVPIPGSLQGQVQGLSTGPSNGSGGGGAAAPAAQQSSDPFQQALDSAFGAENSYLDQAQSALEGAQGGITQGINQGIDTSKTNLDATHQAGLGQIDQSQQSGEQRHQDALVAARRLYNELIQGGQQRFGGASSAGEAYGALTGRELQRNNQQTNTDFSSFMGQVSTAKTNLQTQYENGVRTLEQQRNDALAQANRDYQDKLLSIQHDRSQAAGAKAQAQLSLLQGLRNNIYAINVAQAQNTGTLQSALSNAQSQLDQYTQSMNQNTGNVGQAQTAFNANTNTNPTTAYNINAGGGQGQVAPTGQIAQGQGQRDRFGNLLYATA